MVIRIKNKMLYKKVMARCDAIDKKQIECIKKGDYKGYKILAKKSDKIYDSNYDKMFEIKVNGKVLKSYKKL